MPKPTRLLLATLPIMCLTRLTPDLTSDRWNELDCKLVGLLGPLHWRISQKEVATNAAADELGEILTNFLRSEPEFEATGKQFFEKKKAKSLEQARILKKELKKVARKRGATAEEKAEWLKAVKLYAYLLRKEKRREEGSRIREQEKAYRKDFFSFAKDACNGTLGEERVQPQFSVEEANIFFPGRYSTPTVLDINKLDWMVSPPPPAIPYNQSAIRPSQVKNILKSKAPNKSPGEDGLLYGVLLRLPSIHHVLATLFTRTNESNLAPASWATSSVILAHKGGDPKDPNQFRMLALTSCIGKIYHQIKADRLSEFMIENDYIDQATQKAFIKQVNGCVEHTQVLSEVIQDAKHRRKTVHISWFDLKDAYGSIPHLLIQYCMRLYHVPPGEIEYIMNLYSQLKGAVTTKEWKSDIFTFVNGIFTGDTLSPTVFNVTFQPLIDYIKSKKGGSGYSLGSSKAVTQETGWP